MPLAKLAHVVQQTYLSLTHARTQTLSLSLPLSHTLSRRHATHTHSLSLCLSLSLYLSLSLSLSGTRDEHLGTAPCYYLCFSLRRVNQCSRPDKVKLTRRPELTTLDERILATHTLFFLPVKRPSLMLKVETGGVQRRLPLAVSLSGSGVKF